MHSDILSDIFSCLHLTFFLAVYLPMYLTIWHSIVSDILSDMCSDIYLSFVLALCLTYILTILTDILSDMLCSPHNVFRGRRGTCGTFWSLKRPFVWQVQDIGHFFIRVAGMALSAPCFGSRGSKWEVVLEVFFRGRRGTWWQIALVVARSSFWDLSRHPLITLCMSDRSRCGAVQMLRSLAQPFRHFVHVRSLSLWHSAVLKIKEILQRDLDNEVCHRELAQILPGGLL